MEYLDLCRMREVGYTSTKLLSVHVRDAFRISTWSLSQARNSRPVLPDGMDDFQPKSSQNPA